MSKQFREAFDAIHATDQMKQRTCDFVQAALAKRQRKQHRSPLRYATACCAMLAVMLFGGYSLYITPVSYISVDVNPSVELGLNRFDRVVTVDAYNDDGAILLQQLDLKNKSYTQAIEQLLADKSFSRYLKADALLTFAVISDKEDVLLEGIQQCRGYAESNAECYGANAQLREDAHRSGLSFGKYRAFLELSQYDSTITAEDCKDLSMRQIRDLIRQYQDGVDNPTVSESGHGNGNGQGYGQGGGKGKGNGQGNGYRGGRGNATN